MEYSNLIIEISKILFGVIIGALFTTWYKDFREKKKVKRELFVRMIKARGYVMIPQSLIDDLNAIDILFRNNKKVIERWRNYLAELSAPPETVDYQKQNHLYYDLLREIGNSVGYSNLDNKTLYATYIPNVSLEAHLSSQDFHAELMGYLKNGNEFYKVLLENAKNGQASQDQK